MKDGRILHFSKILKDKFFNSSTDTSQDVKEVLVTHYTPSNPDDASLLRESRFICIILPTLFCNQTIVFVIFRFLHIVFNHKKYTPVVVSPSNLFKMCCLHRNHFSVKSESQAGDFYSVHHQLKGKK